MTFKLNGTAVAEPTALTSEWVVAGAALTRQFTLKYDALNGAALKAILSRLTGATATMNLRDPLTDAQGDVTVKAVSLACPAVVERDGETWYSPCVFTVKQA